MNFVASGRVGADTVHHALQPSSSTDRTVIDLTAMRFAEPAGLVAIAALADHATAHGQFVDVLAPPEHSDASKYLHRMDVQTVLQGLGVSCELSAVRRHDTGTRLMELTPFDALTREWDSLAERVFEILCSRVGKSAAAALYKSIAEIGVNVAEHSLATRGYLALQYYTPTSTLKFAVADCGIGLRSALAQAHSVSNDEQAIHLATESGISGTGQIGRGLGIAGVIGRTTEGGSVTLWSGTAAGSSIGGAAPTVLACSAAYPGTVVAVTLRV